MGIFTSQGQNTFGGNTNLSNIDLQSQFNKLQNLKLTIFNPLNLTEQMGYGNIIPNTSTTQKYFTPIFKDADGKVDFVATQGLNNQQFTIPQGMDYNAYKKPDNSQTTTDATSQWLNYLGGGVNIGTSIANTVLGYKNFEQNKKLINKQIEAAQEQIEASKEYRQQRRDEIARLNRVRSNTTKAFNTGSVITRSY